MTETTFQNHLLVALSTRQYLRVWRQMVGTAYVPMGTQGTAVLRHAASQGHCRVIDMGPPTGAADLSGITERGLRLEVECKGIRTRTTPEQHQWANFIRSQGGVYVLARASDDLDASVAAAVHDVDLAIAAAHNR